MVTHFQKNPEWLPPSFNKKYFTKNLKWKKVQKSFFISNQKTNKTIITYEHLLNDIHSINIQLILSKMNIFHIKCWCISLFLGLECFYFNCEEITCLSSSAWTVTTCLRANCQLKAGPYHNSFHSHLKTALWTKSKSKEASLFPARSQIPLESGICFGPVHRRAIMHHRELMLYVYFLIRPMIGSCIKSDPQSGPYCDSSKTGRLNLSQLL